MPEEHEVDSRPHLVIPYWKPTTPTTSPDDGNTRPVPGNVVWYLCPGIKASPYRPGERLDVSVEVGNFGGANTPSTAHVTVWWSVPSAGFVVSPDKLIGVTTVPVDGRGGHATSPVMSKVMPGTAPDHICLLARVSHQYDRAGAKVDPVNDRHWAQRNLVALTATPGAPLVFPFMVGNPLVDEAQFFVTVEHAREERFPGLAASVHAEPVLVEASLALGVDEPGREPSLWVELGPGEQRELTLTIDLYTELREGQFAAFEISQRADDRDILGGLGVIVRGT